MTSKVDLSFIRDINLLTGYRICVAVVMDGIAKREILQNKNSIQIIRQLSFRDLWRGFQPTAIRFWLNSYLQVGTTWVASRLTPQDLSPWAKGFVIGAMTSSIEATARNIWNVLDTRFIQGEKWNVVKREGLSLFVKGLSPAIAHRWASSLVFWGAYEPLYQKYRDPFAVGCVVGLIQVGLTSPLYNAVVLRQGKRDPHLPPLPPHLPGLLKHMYQKHGITGLYGRAVPPRAVHSLAISGFLMSFYEKYGVISRQK